MNALMTVVAVIFVTAFSSTATFAAEPTGDMDADRSTPGVMAGASAKGMATVEAVDMESREVSLRLADGELMTFVAGDEVRNLAQVKVGDRVVVEYDIGLVMALNPSASGMRSRVDRVETGRAELGQKPAAVVRKTIEATATVMAVDRQARTLTLKGAQRTVTLPVADDIDISNVKVGDQVDAVYQESLAISVQPAPAGKEPESP